jgi:hypothetical protein
MYISIFFHPYPKCHEVADHIIHYEDHQRHHPFRRRRSNYSCPGKLDSR